MTSARVYHPEIFKLSLASIEANCTKAENGCWEWNGNKHQGYGVVYRAKKRYRVHRAVLVLTAGHPSNLAMEACHSCNNKACCNPEHLRWGTPKENMRQARADGLINHVPRASVGLSNTKLLALKYLKKYPIRVVSQMFGISPTVLQTWKAQAKKAGL